MYFINQSRDINVILESRLVKPEDCRLRVLCYKVKDVFDNSVHTMAV